MRLLLALLLVLAAPAQATVVDEQKLCQYPLWDVDPLAGPQSAVLQTPVPARLSPEAVRQRTQWYRKTAERLDRGVTELRKGLEQGYRAPRSAVERVMAQLDGLLAVPAEKSALVTRQPQLQAAANDKLWPALARYRSFLSDYLPRARTEVGVSANPNGSACYAQIVRNRTNGEFSPEQLHQLGLAEVARSEAELRPLAQSLFGSDDLAAVFAHLRSEPQFAFTSAAEIESVTRQAIERARNALIKAFSGPLPPPVEVRTIPAGLARDHAAGYYQPGVFFVNTYRPEARPRFTAEALAFHEALPGHHLQFSQAGKTSSSSDTLAFVEGWGLYAEGLADELGLYSSDLDRLGRFNYATWRSARLVVDTGLHALGWSRAQAIDYLLAHTALSLLDIENEVDRYIAWPGQALTYKVGERAIRQLRAQAEAQLGAKFSLPAFHGAVLGGGPVTLTQLRRQVNQWIAETR